MKLRIKGNSIRLRLTRSEVEQFGHSGLISAQLTFPGAGDCYMQYAIRAQKGLSSCEVSFDNQSIMVRIPSEIAQNWVETEEVGIEHNEPLERGEIFQLLIEKDFACLHRQPGDDAQDAYPHPAEKEG